MLLGLHISLFGGVPAGALVVFGVCWISFYLSNRHKGYFFFDPQDCAAAGLEGRLLPLAAKTATFEPLLKHYIGVTQLLVTVAAASIAFGGSNQPPGPSPVNATKLLLAWSVFYGVAFCPVLLWRYDEYAQDMTSYTLSWYSTIFALGCSSLLCFVSGYLWWGWELM